MKVLLHTSVGITNYLDPYYKVKCYLSVTQVLLKKFSKRILKFTKNLKRLKWL